MGFKFVRTNQKNLTASDIVYKTAVKQSQQQKYFDGKKRYPVEGAKALGVGLGTVVSAYCGQNIYTNGRKLITGDKDISFESFGFNEPVLQHLGDIGNILMVVGLAYVIGRGSYSFLKKKLNPQLRESKQLYRERRAEKFEKKLVKKLEKNGFKVESGMITSVHGDQNDDTMNATKMFKVAKNAFLESTKIYKNKQHQIMTLQVAA